MTGKEVHKELLRKEMIPLLRCTGLSGNPTSVMMAAVCGIGIAGSNFQPCRKSMKKRYKEQRTS